MGASWPPSTLGLPTGSTTQGEGRMASNDDLILQRFPVAVVCAQTEEGNVLGRSFALWPLLDGDLDVTSREQMIAALEEGQRILSGSPELDAEGADAFAMPCDGRRVMFFSCPAVLPEAELRQALGALPEKFMPSPVFRLGHGEALAACQSSVKSGSLKNIQGVSEHWGQIDVAGYSALRDHDAGKAPGQDVVAHFGKGDRLLAGRRKILKERQEMEAALLAEPDVVGPIAAHGEPAPASTADREPTLAEKLQAKRKFSNALAPLDKAPLLIVSFNTNYSMEGMMSAMPMYDRNTLVIPLQDVLGGDWSDHCPRCPASEQELASKTQESIKRALNAHGESWNGKGLIPSQENFFASFQTQFANGRWIVSGGDEETNSFHLRKGFENVIEEAAQSVVQAFSKTEPVAFNAPIQDRPAQARDIDLMERLARGEALDQALDRVKSAHPAEKNKNWLGVPRAQVSESDAMKLVHDNPKLLALIAKLDLGLATGRAPIKPETERPGL
jgi:hypothetical protein